MELALFGKLTLSAVPYHNPIVMGAVGGALFIAAVILGLITYFGKWGYLWREWLTSVDHKRIGVMYIVLALVMLLRGFSDAIMMRAQQAVAVGAAQGYLPPEHYDQIFSAHGTIMIFFMAMPFLVGLMNIAVPLQIGARDVAFPFLNSVSLWLTVFSAALIMVSLGVGDFSRAGWSGYPPLSELRYSPDTGVDYWIWSLQLSGLGTLMTGINFFVTILRMRAPGMTLMRMPIFCWSALVTTILIIAAFPVLTVTLAMLTLDRYLDMHFFTNGMGGNMMMYPNLFWLWGHPEVYIIILPAFGVYSEVVATFSGKRLFGYRSMVYATCAIGILSFSVWLHHFFTMGAGADVNAVFGIATMIIAVPTGVKIFNWLFTMYRGRLRFSLPILWTLAFIVTFCVGGMAGVLLAVPPADFVLHNSEFLIAHFHNMLIPGALFGYFAGYAYWFPKVFGFRLEEKWGKRAFWAWVIGFYLAFMPLYALGFMGMVRRLEHYTNPAWQPYLEVAALGAVVILFGIIFQVIQLVVSIRHRERTRDLTGDPWDGRTLEWSVASPPPFYNFAETPVVTGLDAFAEQKETGTAYRRPLRYKPIHMPANSPAGLVIGAFGFLFGFAMIWYIWWLALAGAAGILVTLVVRGANDEASYFVPAGEVEHIEEARYSALNDLTVPAGATSLSTEDAIPVTAAAHPTQHDSAANAAFGFWIYIMSDCVLFATVFAGFAVLGHNYAGGPTGRDLFNLPYVLGETLFLLLSSVTYGFAVLAMQAEAKRMVLAWLALTFLLGLGFIGMELNEFTHLVLEGNGPERSGFLSAFFTLVGTHGTHVSFGLIWIVAMIGQIMGKGLTAPVRSRLMRLSIFWHFLDIVWVGVFTIVYLMGVM